MAVTKATLATAVLLAVRSGPYTADAAFADRVTAIVGSTIAQVNGMLAWWYGRQGHTVTADQVENDLEAIAYHGSCMAVFADLGRLERTQASAAVYGSLVQSFIKAYGGDRQ